MEKINLQQDTLQKMILLATERRIELDALVNEILEQYLTTQPIVKHKNDPAFLLSMAGMFESDVSNSSEIVNKIVADFSK